MIVSALACATSPPFGPPAQRATAPRHSLPSACSMKRNDITLCFHPPALCSRGVELPRPLPSVVGTIMHIAPAHYTRNHNDDVRRAARHSVATRHTIAPLRHPDAGRHHRPWRSPMTRRDRCGTAAERGSLPGGPRAASSRPCTVGQEAEGKEEVYHGLAAALWRVHSASVIHLCALLKC